MEAKEKANELVDKNQEVLNEHIFNGNYDIAVELALICVNDVMEVAQMLGNDTVIDYYTEVKQEIEKL